MQINVAQGMDHEHGNKTSVFITFWRGTFSEELPASQEVRFMEIMIQIRIKYRYYL